MSQSARFGRVAEGPVDSAFVEACLNIFITLRRLADIWQKLLAKVTYNKVHKHKQGQVH